MDLASAVSIFEPIGDGATGLHKLLRDPKTRVLAVVGQTSADIVPARSWRESARLAATPRAATVQTPRTGTFSATGGDLIEHVKDEDGVPTTRKLASFDDPVTSLALDFDYALWVALASRGLAVFSHPHEADSPRRNFLTGRELPANFPRPQFFGVGGSLFATSGSAMFRLGDGHVTAQAWPSDLILSRIDTANRSTTWAIGRWRDGPERLLHLRFEKGVLASRCFRVDELTLSGAALEILAEPEPDAPVWINGTMALLRVDPGELTVESSTPSLLAARWITPDESRRLPLGRPTRLSFSKDALLEIDLRDSDDPLFGRGPILCAVNSDNGPWAAIDGSLAIRTAPPGPIRVYAKCQGGTPALVFSALVDPPWYRTTWAIALFVSAALAAAAGIFAWRSRRIRKSNTELARLVTERTEALEQSVTARSAMLARLAHEILNPLNAVTGLAFRLTRERDDDARAAIARQVADNARIAVAAVEEALSAQAPRGPGAPGFPVACRLALLVERACASFPEARARLAVLPIPDSLVGPRLGQPERIVLVLVNLISNALKYAPGEPVTVSATAGVGDEVALSVADRGPGLSAADQRTLFRPFGRTADAKDAKIPGTGLGLTICRTYAEQMGGRIELQSAPGHGSIFTLHVPMPAVAAGPGQRSPHDGPLEGRSALVLDDQEINRAVLADSLALLGCRTLGAGKIADAQQLFRETPPDLAFVDFELGPGESGVDFVRWLRAQPAPLARTPAVIVSAYPIEFIRTECDAAGASLCLFKPITAAKLSAAAQTLGFASAGSPDLTTPPRVAADFESLYESPADRASLRARIAGDMRAEIATALRHGRGARWTESAAAAHRCLSLAVLTSDVTVVAAAKRAQAAARARVWPETRASLHDLIAALGAAGYAKAPRISGARDRAD